MTVDFSEAAIGEGILACQNYRDGTSFTVFPIGVLNIYMNEATTDLEYYTKYAKYPSSTTSKRKMANLAWNFAWDIQRLSAGCQERRALADELYALNSTWPTPYQKHRRGKKRVCYKDLIDYCAKRVSIMQRIKTLWEKQND